MAESGKLYGEGVPWPASLIAYLDRPPDDQRVFMWLCACLGDLLEYLGVATDELMDAVSVAQHQSIEGPDFEEIERRAWTLWIRRADEGDSVTAVAQLLFALSRAEVSDRRLLAANRSMPIWLLQRLETRTGEVFDRVIEHFAKHVGDGSA